MFILKNYVIIIVFILCGILQQTTPTNIFRNVMSYKVEIVPDARCNLGEGPHWDIETQSLYMVDLDQASLLRYDFNKNVTYRAKIEGESFAGFVIPIQGQKNKFAVGCGRRVVVVNWDGISKHALVEREIFSVQQDEKYVLNRFNDAKCDAKGRLYGGTMLSTSDCFKKRTGELFMYSKHDNVQKLKSDIGISNGLCWNEKSNKFYYIDTCDHEVKEYDYNPETGLITNPKILFDLHAPDEKDLVFPDGMTIDENGNLYIALYNGNGIYKIDKNGKFLEKINIPCKHVTSVAFGGPNLDVLFVTSSKIDDTNEAAGVTYKITGLGVKGLPMYKMQI